MRWRITIVAAAMAACLGMARPQAGKSDQDALQGVWRLVSGEMGGKPLPDEEVKKSVAELLRQFHLDESAIEAEAIKKLAPELETLDRMLMSLEVRRDRALRSIAEYRGSFAERVREASDRIIESEPILQLEKIAGQRSA